MLNPWWGFCLELHTMIKYNIYIIYFKCKWGQNQGVTVINNTFCYYFTIRNLSDFNIIRGEYELLWRACVGHLIHWQEVRGKTWNIQYITKLTMVKIYLSFAKLSVRESSPSTISGPFDMSREENASLVETICLEAPESMMKLGELVVLATNAWTLSLSLLNLILLPSSLSNHKGRCFFSPGVSSNCQFSFSYKSS